MTRSLEVLARGRSGEEGLLHLGPVALAAQTAGLGLERGSCASGGGALVLLLHRWGKRHRQAGLSFRYSGLNLVKQIKFKAAISFRNIM